MADAPDGPDSLEGMAFQLILQKLGSLERAMQATVPLLKKIIDHLEAQTAQPDVEVATYAQLYPEVAEADETAEAPAETEAPRRRRRLWHWFIKEH